MKRKKLSKLAKAGIIIGILIIIALVYLFVNFLINKPSLTSMRDNSTLVIDLFYSHLNNEDYDKILDLIHEDWYEKTSRGDTLKFFSDVNKLGLANNYTLVGWQVTNFDVFAGDEKGVHSTIELAYLVERNQTEYLESFVVYHYERSEGYFLKGYHLDTAPKGLKPIEE